MHPEQIHVSAAQRLLQSAVVWDNVWPVDLPGLGSADNGWEQLERFARAGVSAVGVTLAGDTHNSAEALRITAWARHELQSRSSLLKLVEKVEDIVSAKRAGQLAVVLQFEGTRCFERDLNLIDAFYALGVRQTLLAFNSANCAGSGCAEPADGGLTPYGRRFVREAERIGMLVDLSHVGRRTSLDALAIAQQPMVFSHSNANAIHSSFRNIDDEQARACAATGGLVGISGSSEYLGDPKCRTQTLFRHLDHYVQLLGPAHVGLGFDVIFNAEPVNAFVRARPEEWPMAKDPAWPGFNYAVPEQIVELIGVMLANGYSESAVEDILGRNYLRICSQVWR
ncbi:dipeptidase [Peristeroidobacter soli]|jgi:membrane dipeptidase|uniref:dipeptidase n=1 Tax=Peristeroidobacter soli TaxID=2497877 RepID=UPI00101DFC2B|nr:membrane dipeptidase [Peristeroidobacter soli]